MKCDSYLITLKLFGTIATDFGGKQLSLEFINEKNSLKDILVKIKEKFPKYFPNYFDDDFTPKRGTLILINGADFNTIDGLDTIVSTSDQVSLIPTISGG